MKGKAEKISNFTVLNFYIYEYKLILKWKNMAQLVRYALASFDTVKLSKYV